MEQEEILSVKNLTYSYDGNRQALNHISLVIGRNEKIAVLGANGAGKSTFFLNLNGVFTPEEGEIRFHGEKITKKTLNKLRKNVGYVFQDPDDQIIASTVKSEVAFGPVNLKLSIEEVESRTNQALEQMSLTSFADRPPHYLSGGEKKRVGIADVLAMEPEIILFDEPQAALDPVNAQMLENVLKDLSEEEKTLIISTHDVDFAYRWADRILVFCGGELIRDASAPEIFADADLLEKANLKKPMLLELCECLKEEGILAEHIPFPRSLGELRAEIKLHR